MADASLKHRHPAMKDRLNFDLKHFVPYVEKRGHRLAGLLLRLEPPYRVQDIHALRVEIKKLKAVFRLLRPEMEASSAGNAASIIRNLFRQAGAVRDWHLLISYLKKSAATKRCPVLEKLLNVRLGKAESGLHRAIRKKEVLTALNRLLDEARQVRSGGMKSCIRKQSKKLNRLLAAAPRQPEQLHRLRVKMKELSYLQAACGRKEEKYIAWMQQAGCWHDTVTRLHLLSEIVQEPQMPASVVSCLQRLMSRQQKKAGIQLLQLVQQLPA